MGIMDQGAKSRTSQHGRIARERLEGLDGLEERCARERLPEQNLRFLPALQIQYHTPAYLGGVDFGILDLGRVGFKRFQWVASAGGRVRGASPGGSPTLGKRHF